MAERNKLNPLFVGIDWGSQSHQVCVMDERRVVLLEAAFPHSGTGLSEMVAAILRAADETLTRLAIAIEQPRGAVVETSLEKGVAVFSINPKRLDRFRDRHTVSGAKDDRRDAFVLADSLRTDMPAFRRARLGDPLLVQLRELSRMQEELKADRIALGNRLRSPPVSGALAWPSEPWRWRPIARHARRRAREAGKPYSVDYPRGTAVAQPVRAP